MPERFRKGGDVSALTQAITDGNSADRVALFKQAAAEGSWLAASVKTPQLLEPLIENVTETISAYKSAMETGKTLLNANKVFLIAAINPLFLILDEMISEVQRQIDDLMGSGIYTLFIDGQNPKLSVYGVKARTPKIRLKKIKTAGIYVNPFTNRIEFSAHPIIDIDKLKAGEELATDAGFFMGADVDPKHALEGPEAAGTWQQFENNHKNYVIWNGKVFYNRAIPGVSGSAQGKPVLDKTGGEYLDLNLEDYLWKMGGQMQICKPSKMIEIMNAAFDDKGDVSRPSISGGNMAGALIILLGVTDPAKLLGKIAKLYNYFADIRPLKDAMDIARELTEDLDALREEKIIVTNLCAPNPGNINPPIEKWPIKPGKKSNLKADRGIFKIGTNSDNKEKFRRRGYDINSNKDDKVFFKNLRTRETMQILSTETARQFNAPTTMGTDETSNAEWYEHITPGVNAVAAETSISMFTQGQTVRYEQVIDVLHESIFPNTRPGDILVEVELDDRMGQLDDEGKEAKPDPGGGDAFKILNSFVLKNGTKIFGEDDQKEDIMKRIMEIRFWKANQESAGKQLELYSYYNNKMKEGKYDEELTYNRPLTKDESSSERERLEASVNKVKSARSEQEELIKSIESKIEGLKTSGSIGGSFDVSEAQLISMDKKNDKIAELKGVQNQIGDRESEIVRLNDTIKFAEKQMSLFEKQKSKELENFSKDQADVEKSQDKQIDAEEDLNELTTDLTNKEQEVLDYETSKAKEIYNESYKLKYIELKANENSEADAATGAKNYATEQSTTLLVQKALKDDETYAEITQERDELKTKKSSAQKILDDATEANKLAHIVLPLPADVVKYNAWIQAELVTINTTEKLKQEEQTKIQELEARATKIEQELVILELEIASKHSRFEDQIQALQVDLVNANSKSNALEEEHQDTYIDYLESMKEVDKIGRPTIAWGNVQANTDKDAGGLQSGNPMEAAYLKWSGGPDPQGERIWKNALMKLTTDDPDGVYPTKDPPEPDELDELTDEESAYAAAMILEGSGLNPSDMNVDMLRYFEAVLDGYLWLPNWRNQGSANLPAPRVCSVRAVNKNTSKKEDLPESVYPDFWSYNVEDMIPGLRGFLEVIIDFLEGLKGIGSGLIKKIEELVEFIEEKIIPKLEKILKMMEEFLELITLGIVDAGIYFLWIPPATGGTDMIRKKLTSAANPPPENLDFTYAMMILLGGTDPRMISKVLEGAGLV